MIRQLHAPAPNERGQAPAASGIVDAWRSNERMRHLWQQRAAVQPLHLATMLLAMLASCSPAPADGKDAAREGNEQEGMPAKEAEPSSKADGAFSATPIVNASGTELIVSLNNQYRSPVCIGYNYMASTRLSMYRGRSAVGLPYAFEGRPMPGCHVLAPGESIRVSYNLAELIASTGQSRPTRLCYSLAWRLGGYSEEGLDQVVRGCSEIPPGDRSTQVARPDRSSAARPARAADQRIASSR